MKHLTLVILLALAPLCWGDEPLMTTPFKCIVDYKGGVYHEKESQGASAFNLTGEEFRLVPRTRMPAGPVELLDERVGMEADVYKYETGVLEFYTYFVRQAKDDPLRVTSWEACFLSSVASGDNQMVCGTHHRRTGSLFRMNLDTKRFVYAYLGSWDSPPLKDGYYGDSSFFSFGRCRPYYD